MARTDRSDTPRQVTRRGRTRRPRLVRAGAMRHPATLVIATANPDKLREIQELLAGIEVDVVPIGRWSDYVPPAETGETLRENATLKAQAASRHTGLPAVADDTGLEVDALDGSPGVFAARFAGEHATYRDNRAKLLRLLRGVPRLRRRAVFRTAVALCLPDGECLHVEGECEGLITEEERGEEGFGYDRVFEVPSVGLTFAEMDGPTKHTFSHRGDALRRLRAVIDDLAETGRLSASTAPAPSPLRPAPERE